MTAFDPQAYGPACAELLDAAPRNELGPGSPDRAALQRLRELDERSLLGERPLVDRDMAACCLAGLWLRYDYLDESHRISQNVGSSSGSYWHAIMHRREGDFSNAKYWFRRVGEHAVFDDLSAAARELAADAQLDDASAYLAEPAAWDPFRFVDLCAAVVGGRSPSEALCRDLARAEWQLLFDYCYRRASGR